MLQSFQQEVAVVILQPSIGPLLIQPVAVRETSVIPNSA
jgi:hypothetical protein